MHVGVWVWVGELVDVCVCERERERERAEGIVQCVFVGVDETDRQTDRDRESQRMVAKD